LGLIRESDLLQALAASYWNVVVLLLPSVAGQADTGGVALMIVSVIEAMVAVY